MPVPLKYGLLQLPGLALAAAGLGWLCNAGLLSSGAAWVLLVLWVAKDVALYPLLRSAYDSSPGSLVGVERLIGACGVVEEALAPTGYVRVGGELWRAECSDPGDRVPPRSRVCVRAVRGLTLVVCPAEETPPRAGC